MVSTFIAQPTVSQGVNVVQSVPSCVLAKTTDGTELYVRVIVDSKFSTYYYAPFSIASFPPGPHTFAAPPSTLVNGLVYSFDHWQDEKGVFVSGSPSFLYNLQSAKSFYAIYKPPSFSLVVFVGDYGTHRQISGASVYLDGNRVGKTDANGRLALIGGVSPGSHTLKITMNGYNDYLTTINVRSSTSYMALLTRK